MKINIELRKNGIPNSSIESKDSVNYTIEKRTA